MLISPPAFAFLGIPFFESILKTIVGKPYDTTKGRNSALTTQATSHLGVVVANCSRSRA
jgi:hypothetical protein